MHEHARTAVVLLVGEKYFSGIMASKRASFAWSLAGAMLFGPWQLDLIERFEATLRAKGYEPRRANVAVL